jgi:hypothetical protein
MKRVLVILIVGFIIGLGLSGCGDSGEPGKEGGIGMTKARTIIMPGWQCPNHQNIKSAYPGKCPIDKMQMRRVGEWTCSDHPNISSTQQSSCPIGGKDLVKVVDLEKQTGKSIADLTKEYQAAEKGNK